MNTRKLKFRAWDSRYNCMYEWNNLALEEKQVFISDGDLYRHYDDELHVMQFTGLYDKNGVEIFEGDLLKTHNKGLANPENILAVKYSGSSFVIYNPNCCEVCKNGFGCISNLDEWRDYEVIGNLYETPELLTK